jgi:tRNA(Ile)-lysidine synthase
MKQQPDRGGTPAIWPSLCQRFAQAFDPQRHARLGIVIAVSGGADSIALLRLIADVWDTHEKTDRRQLIVAHFNHATRGEDSDADQRFVGELAQSLEIEFVTETLGLPYGTQEASDEESLRKRRYDFLRRTVAARGGRCVLTAHTADDQVETVLHHLFRGTGPAGLCGIPAARTLAEDFMLLRPLLSISKADLRAGLIEIGQPWREDHSNNDSDYQRNWIRNELLPQIRSRYPAADDAILRLVQSQSQWHQALRRHAQRWIDDQLAFVDDQIRIRRGPVEPPVFGLALTMIWDRAGWPRQSLSAMHFQSMAALVAGDGDAAVNLPGNVRAEAADDGLVVVRRIVREQHHPARLCDESG